MKTLKISFLTSTILVCALGGAAQTRVPESDTQFWTDVVFTIPLSKKVDFLVLGTLRMGDNLSTPVDGRWGAGFNHKLNQHLTLNWSYFNREARPPNGRRERETRLTFGATVQFSIGKFTLDDRNAFERRWRSPQVDAWRYRNRIRLAHPFQINKTNFSWFVSDEFFYDWSFHDWVRNRAAIGVSHTFNKHFTGDLYYMRQNDGRTRPGDLHIIGTTLRFRM